MTKLEMVFKRYEVKENATELKKVLTHNSFSENNNSRYVFLGQYAFRGKVAEYIYKNTAGTGTQLQQFLGNIMSTKNLANYFDFWQLKTPRIADTISIDSQKHIFVLSVLGYILENSAEENVMKFIYEEFILPQDHQLPQNYVYKNQWEQIKFLCKRHFQSTPKLVVKCDENKISTITIAL